MSRTLASLVVLASSLVVGCTDEPGGKPPSISDLSLSPTALTARQQNTIAGSLAFVDPDADVLELGVSVELPDGSRQTLPATDVLSSAGVTEGSIQVTLAIVPPAVGAYRFELWLVDALGSESNRLEATAQAQ